MVWRRLWPPSNVPSARPDHATLIRLRLASHIIPRFQARWLSAKAWLPFIPQVLHQFLHSFSLAFFVLLHYTPRKEISPASAYALQLAFHTAAILALHHNFRAYTPRRFILWVFGEFWSEGGRTPGVHSHRLFSYDFPHLSFLMFSFQKCTSKHVHYRHLL